MVTSDVRLVEAWQVEQAQAFFRNVWPMYVHEIAGFDTDFYRLDATGRWLPDLVEDWIAAQTPVANLRHAPWDESAGPQQRCHVIVTDGLPVGFVCIAVPPFKYMPTDVDVQVAELFIASPYRARGVATRAMELLFPQYRGRWHLAAIHDNARAIRFWQRALPALGVRDLRESVEGREVRFFFAT